MLNPPQEMMENPEKWKISPIIPYIWKKWEGLSGFYTL